MTKIWLAIINPSTPDYLYLVYKTKPTVKQIKDDFHKKYKDYKRSDWKDSLHLDIEEIEVR